MRDAPMDISSNVALEHSVPTVALLGDKMVLSNMPDCDFNGEVVACSMDVYDKLKNLGGADNCNDEKLVEWDDVSTLETYHSNLQAFHENMKIYKEGVYANAVSHESKQHPIVENVLNDNSKLTNMDKAATVPSLPQTNLDDKFNTLEKFVDAVRSQKGFIETVVAEQSAMVQAIESPSLNGYVFSEGDKNACEVSDVVIIADNTLRSKACATPSEFGKFSKGYDYPLPFEGLPNEKGAVETEKIAFETYVDGVEQAVDASNVKTKDALHKWKQNQSVRYGNGIAQEHVYVTARTCLNSIMCSSAQECSSLTNEVVCATEAAVSGEGVSPEHEKMVSFMKAESEKLSKKLVEIYSLAVPEFNCETFWKDSIIWTNAAMTYMQKIAQSVADVYNLNEHLEVGVEGDKSTFSMSSLFGPEFRSFALQEYLFDKVKAEHSAYKLAFEKASAWYATVKGIHVSVSAFESFMQAIKESAGTDGDLVNWLQGVKDKYKMIYEFKDTSGESTKLDLQLLTNMTMTIENVLSALEAFKNNVQKVKDEKIEKWKVRSSKAAEVKSQSALHMFSASTSKPESFASYFEQVKNCYEQAEENYNKAANQDSFVSFFTNNDISKVSNVKTKIASVVSAVKEYGTVEEVAAMAIKHFEEDALGKMVQSWIDVVNSANGDVDVMEQNLRVELSKTENFKCSTNIQQCMMQLVHTHTASSHDKLFSSFAVNEEDFKKNVEVLSLAVEAVGYEAVYNEYVNTDIGRFKITENYKVPDNGSNADQPPLETSRKYIQLLEKALNQQKDDNRNHHTQNDKNDTHSDATKSHDDQPHGNPKEQHHHQQHEQQQQQQQQQHQEKPSTPIAIKDDGKSEKPMKKVKESSSAEAGTIEDKVIRKVDSNSKNAAQNAQSGPQTLMTISATRV